MRYKPTPILLLALLLISGLGGCVGPGDGVAPQEDPGESVATDAGTAPAAPSPEPDPPTPEDLPPALPEPVPQVALLLKDARLRPLDPLTLRIVVELDAPTSRSLDLSWSDAATPRPQTATFPDNTTRWSTDLDLDLPPGPHTLQLQAVWADDDDDDTQDHSRTYDTTLALVVWDSVRLVLNASERYADDQNAFHSDHPIPFASWAQESALDLLERAAETYGFQVKTQYRADMEATFVDAINGTAFRWEVEPAGISRNWMLLMDDTATRTAADHTLPEPGQTVEYRYVRCYATGNCDDL